MLINFLLLSGCMLLLCVICTAVDPSNAVALCHRGRALLMMHQDTAARADLSTALQLLQDGIGGKDVQGSPGYMAHMELNGSSWQQRVQGLLASITDQSSK
jgi:hypothetical protein